MHSGKVCCRCAGLSSARFHTPEESIAAVASTSNREGEARGLVAHALTGVADGSGDKLEESLNGVEEWVGNTGAHHTTD